VLGAALAYTSPAHAAPQAREEYSAAHEEDRDDVRLRGGFSFNGGALFLPQSDNAYGGVIGLGLRLGVQFTDLFSLYYQNTPFVTLVLDPSKSFTAGAMDYNTLLVGFTMWNWLDLGVGGGADIIGTYVCKAGTPTTLADGTASPVVIPDCSRQARVAPGAHLRLAVDIGSDPTPYQSRRSAFTVGIDLHPSFVIDSGATPVLVTLTAGIGGEWY